MTETNDTIDGLLAEFRGYSAGMPPSYHVTMSWHDFRRMLDRFDAAWKRDTKELRKEIERLKEERNYSGVRERERLRANGFAIVPKEQLERGDCAKLREALKAISGLCARLIPTWDGAIGRIKDIAEAALAAPPRNCDKYATADEALKAQEQMFNDSNFANGECKLGCPECDNPRVGCKIAWLFAPATEKEGGAE